MVKDLRKIIFFCLLSYVSCSHAGLMGDAYVTTNYVWRGVSLSDNNLALQADIGYQFDSGVYLSIWGSNTGTGGFISDPTGSDPTAYIEIEYDLGYRGKLANDFLYDIVLARYAYTGGDSFDYNELRFNAAYKIFNFEVSYSNNVFNTATNGTYANVGIALPLPIPKTLVFLENMAITANAGYYALSPQAGGSYSDYKIGVNKKYKNIQLELAWTDTSQTLALPTTLTGSHVFATVTASFG